MALYLYNLNMKKYKDYLIFSIGLIVFSFGISFGNRSLFGGNSMAVLVVGISKHLPLTYGTCNLIVGIIEMLVGLKYDRENVTAISWISLVLCSYLIDFANLFVPVTSNMITRIIFMFLGILGFCLGLALEQTAHIGYSNLDVFTFGLKKAFNIEKYHTIKWIIDIAFISIGFILGSEVSVGTVLLLLFAGILIERFREFFQGKLK